MNWLSIQVRFNISLTIAPQEHSKKTRYNTKACASNPWNAKTKQKLVSSYSFGILSALNASTFSFFFLSLQLLPFFFPRFVFCILFFSLFCKHFPSYRNSVLLFKCNVMYWKVLLHHFHIPIFLLFSYSNELFFFIINRFFFPLHRKASWVSYG